MSSDLSLSVPQAHDPHGHPTKLSALSWIAIIAGVALLAFLIHHSLTAVHEAPAHAEAAADAHAAGSHGETHGDAPGETAAAPHGPPAGYSPPPLWACIPFAGLLLSIAILPLLRATQHWWESNKNRLCVALAFAALAIVYYLLVHPMTVNHTTHATYTGVDSVIHVLEHAILGEYIPFIVLLFSLYVISGGISLSGDLVAKPSVNVAFIGAGTLLASFIGTTGAAMLLIRPLLQTNSERKHVRHTVIFFIFLVCNCGGCLLPIGDPPLFLGYLMGVPFLWTLKLTVEWAVVCGMILLVYYIWDRVAYRRETPSDLIHDRLERKKLTLRGKINLFYLVGVVLCVGLIKPGEPFPLLGFEVFPFMRELMMLALVGLSLRTTAPAIRKANAFNYHAILEVAALFIGIFIAMQIPIEILNAKGASLGLTKPWQFFWATGTLSAFLDNAPTYVVFFTTAESLTHGAGDGILAMAGGKYIAESLLIGISLGAVFMGAMSYIGNGPNFMVKSIAEESGIRMPSFFGYMAYSCLILLPLLVIATFIFLV